MDKKRIEKAVNLLAEATSLVEDIQSDAQSDFDDKSDKWKESEKGEEYEGRLEKLSEALNSIQEAQDSLGDAAGD